MYVKARAWPNDHLCPNLPNLWPTNETVGVVAILTGFYIHVISILLLQQDSIFYLIDFMDCMVFTGSF